MVQIKTLSAGTYDIDESYEELSARLVGVHISASDMFMEFKTKQGSILLNLSNIVSIRRNA